MRRSLLFSCALHGVIVLIALAMTPPRAAHEFSGAAEIALKAAPPPPIPAVAIDVDVLAQAGGGGPMHPTEPAVVVSARAQRRPRRRPRRRLRPRCRGHGDEPRAARARAG